MSATTELAEWERELIESTLPADGTRCGDCWRFRPLREWPLGRRPMLCDRCWLAAVRGEIVRTWSGRQTVVRVATTHPQHGVLDRGTIHATPVSAGWRMVWRVTDHDGHDLGNVAGDYLAAEAVLLDATGWADRLDPTNKTEEES